MRKGKVQENRTLALASCRFYQVVPGQGRSFASFPPVVESMQEETGKNGTSVLHKQHISGA
jgi:hypothetical protein